MRVVEGEEAGAVDFDRGVDSWELDVLADYAGVLEIDRSENEKPEDCLGGGRIAGPVDWILKVPDNCKRCCLQDLIVIVF